MKNTVIIKSFQNGISVYLNEDIPFPELLEEVIFKFRESRNFFKNAKMALVFVFRTCKSLVLINSKLLCYFNLNFTFLYF